MVSVPPSLSIRQAHGRFAAIAGAFSLGVFNDNFYKQAVMLIAVGLGRTSMQGYALVAYTLPFLLLAAPAGWLADRFAKRQAIIACKWLEVLAMLAGASGILLDCWPLVFSMLVLMGVQSALFSPALNGSIPELYPPDYVLRANALLRLGSIAAIFVGISLAGVILVLPGAWLEIPLGRWGVGALVLAAAAAGVLLSYRAYFHPPAAAARPFPWTGPWDTLQSLREILRDRPLATALAVNAFIWGLGSLQILIINPLGLLEFGMNERATSFLIVSQLAGIAGGGLASARLVKPDRWYRLLPASGLGLGICLLLAAAVPLLPPAAARPALFADMAAIGFCAGLFLIPVESFLQLRADPRRKGQIWASANFVVFTFILLSGPLANLMNARLLPTASLGIIGGAVLAGSVGLHFLFHRPSWQETP